jgi:hypothetical protein
MMRKREDFWTVNGDEIVPFTHTNTTLTVTFRIPRIAGSILIFSPPVHQRPQHRSRPAIFANSKPCGKPSCQHDPMTYRHTETNGKIAYKSSNCKTYSLCTVRASLEIYMPSSANVAEQIPHPASSCDFATCGWCTVHCNFLRRMQSR